MLWPPAHSRHRSPSVRRPPGLACFNASDPYYLVMRNGLDAMMQRFLDEARLLAHDQLADATMASKRLDYLFKAGFYDLQDGMKASAQLTTEFVLAQFDSVKQAHVVLFVLSLLLSAAFLALMFRPFLRRCVRGVAGA